MATPTPSHQPPHPSSASKKAPGHVVTPSHFGSPAPRSVPSPATTRKEHAAKTPINHPTNSSHGSKTMGSTPMVQSFSQTGNTVGSSPGANFMSFGTPVGLGLEGITPGLMNLSTPALGAMPMSLTLSDLGLPPAAGLALPKRNAEEERRVSMRKILKSIGKPKGRVSEEGIARVGRRVGFENDIDAEKLTAAERERKVGNRTISIGGKKIIIDVELKNHVPQNVQVAFDTENQSLEAQGGSVAKVLLQDLQVPDGVSLNTNLDRFAENLERLARIDRMCANQVNCFEALSGVYTSLHRLYEQEKSTTPEFDVMRKRSGRPGLHARGRLGLNVDYWQRGARARPGSQPDSDMKLNGDSGGRKAVRREEDSPLRLRIRVEPSPAALYPCVRTADTWLPDPLELPTTDLGDGLPWQNPPPTFVPTGGEVHAVAIDGSSRLPDLRFSAKLVPAIVLPWQTASSIMQSVGLPAPQAFNVTHLQAWHSLVIDPMSTTAYDPNKDSSLTSERNVLSLSDGDEQEITHTYNLDVVKPDMALRLDELPFSHPRQLIEALPILRQWACFSIIVRSIFDNGGPAGTSHTTNGSIVADRPPLSLQDILTPPATPPHLLNKLPINVALVTSPTPTISLTFPLAEAGLPLGKASVQVLPNAELVVTAYDGIMGGKAGDTTEGTADGQRKRMARALEVCGDIGIWVEWLRRAR